VAVNADALKSSTSCQL